MRLLYVAEGIPTRDPVHGDGSSMISYELIKNLPAEVTVTLVTFGAKSELPADIAQRCSEVIILPLRAGIVALARSVPFRDHVGAQLRSTRKAKAVVRRLSRSHDVTLMHGPHVQFLAGVVSGPLVIQVVDPWSMRTEMAAETGPALLRAYRKFKVTQARALELTLPRHAILLTVGERDAQRWSEQLHRPVSSIGNGVDRFERPPRAAGPPVVTFVGSLGYGPNVESAHLLASRIAPRVWQSLPETRFVIAGRNPDPSVLALVADRIEVLPNVPSVIEIFHAADVAVFPDQHGLGVRNSVREALAAGIPVVATSSAAREVEPQELLTTVDDVDEIATTVIRTLADRSSRGGTHRPEIILRTWHDMATDYLAALRRAVDQEGQRVPQSR